MRGEAHKFLVIKLKINDNILCAYKYAVEHKALVLQTESEQLLLFIYAIPGCSYMF